MSTRAPKVPWSRDPHTAAKHQIYKLYLTRWYPILIKGRGWNGDVTYAEGFAGPGVYDRGEPGSPVIALRTLLDDQSLKASLKKARMLFVDDDERCIRRLPGELQAAVPQTSFTRLREHYGIDIRVERGTCEPRLEQLLDETGAWGHPMFVVLDTFGGGVSKRLLSRIASSRGSEVIVTILPQYFARFADAGDITDGDAVYGNDTWRAAAAQPSSAKARWLLENYRDTVRSAGFTHVLDFELIDTRGQALFLVFGTNHRLGLKKMKEVMWEVDDIAGVRYRDPRDPAQQTLAIEVEPQTAPLARLLLDHMRTRPTRRATVVDLREYALLSTVYKEAQVPPVVQRLVDRGDLRLLAGDFVRIGSTVELV